MNVILRGVRAIDPLGEVDHFPVDGWLAEGRLAALAPRVEAEGVPVIDLERSHRDEAMVLCPGLIDLHAHLREPGDEAAETVQSGASAAAAGGYAQVLALANTRPPIDTVERVGEARVRAQRAPVRVLTAAAVTEGLAGTTLIDIRGCALAGAVAFSDDGRNAMGRDVLTAALQAAADVGLPVLIHPEDESLVAASNPGQLPVAYLPDRSPESEVSAVGTALAALEAAGRGWLHLQHISTAPAIALIRQAKERGLPVTAEVTPHHLTMWLPFEEEPQPMALRKVNPPLRTRDDRDALVAALADGVLDAVATDHAPHTAAAKSAAYPQAPPGIIGLETALAACFTLGGLGVDRLPLLINRLTAGPFRVLGPAGLEEPGLRVGEPATCMLFDPLAEWVVGEHPLQSRSRNTPLLGSSLQGCVVLTVAQGRVAYLDTSRMPFPEYLEVLA